MWRFLLSDVSAFCHFAFENGSLRLEGRCNMNRNFVLQLSSPSLPRPKQLESFNKLLHWIIGNNGANIRVELRFLLFALFFFFFFDGPERLLLPLPAPTFRMFPCAFSFQLLQCMKYLLSLCLTKTSRPPSRLSVPYHQNVTFHGSHTQMTVADIN